jgi:ech hydrogenase subunit C
MKKSRVKSPWLLRYDGGSCNGCDIEILACLTPLYDIERFGIVNMGNRKHADILLVTGPANRRNERILRNLYEQMPQPNVVVVVGTSGCTGAHSTTSTMCWAAWTRSSRLMFMCPDALPGRKLL